MKNTIAKKTEGYGYKYTELADINKYCLENDITYYQEVETNEINQKDYIITYLVDKNGIEKKHRGCQIVEARLSGITNPVQQYGSSLTYCRRYSLLMALGLATEDDDGASLTEEKEPTEEDAKNYEFTFGKNKGKKLVDVIEESGDYIDWLVQNSNDTYLLKCISILTGYIKPNDKEIEDRCKLMIEFRNLAIKTKTNEDDIYAHYKVEIMDDMTNEQLVDAINVLKKKVK